MALSLLICASASFAVSEVQEILDVYKTHLENGTYGEQDWSRFAVMPKSRYQTFLFAFEYFVQNGGKTVVELGTSRSFTHGGLPGCNRDETHFWTPSSPENWDWGAGFFTRMAAECLKHTKPTIHTIDIAWQHITRCKHMTSDFKDMINYHVCSSLDFLRNCEPESIDLLYLDTGDMHPIEPTAQMQLAEAKLIVERNVLSPHGIILIDDVRNQTPRVFGDTSGMGKSKYAIPYLLDNNYEILVNEYQVILRKKS